MKVINDDLDYMVAVNFCNTDLINTLGVVKVITNICVALQGKVRIICFSRKKQDFSESQIGQRVADSFDQIMSFEEVRDSMAITTVIEFLPHHFTSPLLGTHTIALCHDLHIYDVKWKYSDFDEREKRFKEILSKADIVITHFPRTYFELERTAGINIRNFYLIESPLMNKSRRDFLVKHNTDPIVTGKYLLYPAQFQRHKGHMELLQSLKNADNSICKIVFVGTECKSSDIQNKAREFVNKHDLSEKVIFQGAVTDNDLENLYTYASGVIIPSRAEGGAYVAMEAIYYSLPVAVNHISQAEMHLKQIGANVKWFNVDDKNSTIEALRYLSTPEQNNSDTEHNEMYVKPKLDSLDWSVVASKCLLLFNYCVGLAERPVCKVGYDYKPRW